MAQSSNAVLMSNTDFRNKLFESAPLEKSKGGTGNTSGNAATATKLAAAKTIGGVSFDGSANINLPGVNEPGNQDTSGNAATATKLVDISNADIARKSVVDASLAALSTLFDDLILSINPVLTDLSITNLAGSMTFAKNTTSYTTSVLKSTTSIDLTPTARSDMSIRVDGDDVDSDEVTNVGLSLGTNNVDVKVITNQNISRTYTIDVIRGAPELSDLVPSTGSLTPSFNGSLVSYTMDVSNNVSDISLVPTADSRWKDPDGDPPTIKVNGETVDSGQASSDISLNVGSNTIPVKVSLNGDEKTYNVAVTREAAAPAAAPAGNQALPSAHHLKTKVDIISAVYQQAYSPGIPLIERNSPFPNSKVWEIDLINESGPLGHRAISVYELFIAKFKNEGGWVIFMATKVNANGYLEKFSFLLDQWDSNAQHEDWTDIQDGKIYKIDTNNVGWLAPSLMNNRKEAQDCFHELKRREIDVYDVVNNARYKNSWIDDTFISS